MPQSHPRSPRADTPADDYRHSINVISPREEGIDRLNQVPKRPNLSPMGVTREHQVHISVSGAIRLPRSMR